MAEEHDELFKEASENAMKKLIAVKNNNAEVKVNDVKERNIKVANDILEAESKGWSDLSNKMNGKFAKKFMDILDSDTISDKEFTKNYLKSLEYFKPKITRQELGIGGEEESNELIIIVKRSNPEPEDIIDITYEDKDL